MGLDLPLKRLILSSPNASFDLNGPDLVWDSTATLLLTWLLFSILKFFSNSASSWRVRSCNEGW